MTLTAEKLRELLHYDSDTGVFTWLVAPKHHSYLLGAQAGCLDAHGYRIIRIGRRGYKAHRLAWLYVHGVWPAGQLDHENRNKGDNRIVNLRSATPSQNTVNTGISSANTSGFKGVTFARRSKRKPWQARISGDGKRRFLGYFATAEEAHAAYLREVGKTHGEFAAKD